MFNQAKDLIKLQREASKIKKKLKKTFIEAEEDGVIVIINGEQKIEKVTIDEANLSDKKKLEKKLETAFNKAIKKSQEVGASLMKDVMGGMGLPGSE